MPSEADVYLSDDSWTVHSFVVALTLFVVIIGLIGWDLVLDYREGSGWPHVAIEGLILFAAASGAAILCRMLQHARSDLARVHGEAAQWREEAHELIRGLGAAIERQFERWSLTRAESEVGLLLMKGLSHKEIAKVRGTSERTAREQARALYRKSGLSGRSALSAFFLEDLLPNQHAESTETR